ncbi:MULTISPECIES: purine-nucleoside phosphorylase [Campylobacter]|uniref:purine-nucleoside phosphorylase n=1 Tax=Campylobacter TaxID=194 RepID=UPI0023F27672|nr:MULTISPECIES: purine-nucleoside phosphorylase [Campylobacter]MCI6641110.1 purine-nucleoside phosphorylase [Campylobacter sp.]MDD7421871.1 purine-nucleoside phosphorylase [Campylobacter hominis]MDY3117427.1 purine-nucleoside phosphorylase [Campylobacter hominis]
MIISAGKNEIFSFAKPVGVGLIETAINLTQILEQNKVRNLIFIGTAGLYKKGEILKVYESSYAANYEISALLSFSYTPLNCEISGNVSYETYKVNSSNFITTDKNSAFKFYERGFFMENMEFFSILKVANTFKIPAYGIFVSTNFCDENAHNDYEKNYKEAKILLTKHLKSKGLI